MNGGKPKERFCGQIKTRKTKMFRARRSRKRACLLRTRFSHCSLLPNCVVWRQFGECFFPELVLTSRAAEISGSTPNLVNEESASHECNEGRVCAKCNVQFGPIKKFAEVMGNRSSFIGHRPAGPWSDTNRPFLRVHQRN